MNKIITLLISLIVCLAASSYAQENSTNAEPSKASESVKGSETPTSSEAGLAKSLEPRGALKIKGLFIGQNVFEAKEIVNKLLASLDLPPTEVSKDTNGVTGDVSYSIGLKSFADNPPIFVQADSTGLVNYFGFDKEVLPKLFKTDNLSQEQFINQFKDGYKLDDFDTKIGTTMGGDDFTYYVLESTSGYMIEYNKMNMGEMKIYKTSSSKDANFN
jgi:hypothetical protein